VASRAQTIAVTTGARLNLRSAPVREPNIIQTMPVGERLLVLADPPQDGFYRVQTSAHTLGWAHGDYLLLPDIVEGEEGDIAAHALKYPDCGGQHSYRWEAKATTSGFGATLHTVSVGDVLGWNAAGFHGHSLSTWCFDRTTKEKRAYEVVGWVTRVRKEDDGDVHVEITEGSGDAVEDCIVVEIPPGDLSPKFQDARDELASLLGVASLTDKDFTTPTQVAFRGLAFWDGWHVSATLPHSHGRCNSTAGAGWELHPVFKIRQP
jgi:hypothetical protein